MLWQPRMLIAELNNTHLHSYNLNGGPIFDIHYVTKSSTSSQIKVIISRSTLQNKYR